MKRSVHISRNFSEAGERDLRENLALTPSERLDILQRLREEYYTFKNENRKGFQRVYRIVKQK